MIQLINKSKHKFEDISSEKLRQYLYSDGTKIILEESLYLSVSDSGGHRLLDSNGDCHYIKPGWLAISWKVKEGQPHFVK